MGLAASQLNIIAPTNEVVPEMSIVDLMDHQVQGKHDWEMYFFWDENERLCHVWECVVCGVETDEPLHEPLLRP